MIKPEKFAQEILKLYCIGHPSELPLEDIVYGEGAVLQYRTMTGCLGQLVRSGGFGIINISSSINDIGRKRFVIAHELGHWKMHQNILPVSLDNHKTLLSGHSSVSKHEREANDFAAELLMPAQYFKPCCKGNLTVESIMNLASSFKTSLLATAFRFVNLGNIPAMLIYSEKGAIQWFKRSDDFRFSFYTDNSKIPTKGLTSDFYRDKAIPDIAEVCLATSWFPNDRSVKENYYLWELVIGYKKINGCMTFLWEHDENHKADEEDRNIYA